MEKEVAVVVGGDDGGGVGRVGGVADLDGVVGGVFFGVGIGVVVDVGVGKCTLTAKQRQGTATAKQRAAC